MSKKQEFVDAWDAEVTLPAISYYRNKEFEAFADLLNEKPHLRTLFYQAVDEANEHANDPATGLNFLFLPRE